MFPYIQSSLILPSLFFAVAALPTNAVAISLLHLTAGNFSTSIHHGVWFVEFFSPTCPHCKEFAPTWKRLAEHVQSQDAPGIHLARVNCLTDGDLCADNNVEGYPSLFLYRDGKQLEEYNRDRNFADLAKYVTHHARKTHAAEEVLNPNGVVLPLDTNTFKEIIKQGPTFVKFFVPWCGHCNNLAPKWIQFASRMRDKVTVAEVNCESYGTLCTSQNVRGYPTILFYQHGRTVDYSGQRTLDALESFIDSALAPPLTNIVLSNLTTLLEQQDVLFLLIHDELDAKIRDAIEEASQPLHGSPKIFSIEASSELLNSLSLPETQSLPVLVSLKDHSMTAHRHLVVSQQSSVEQISHWLITHSLPFSSELSAENFQKIMGSPPPSVNWPPRFVVLGAINLENQGDVNQGDVNVLKQAAKTWHRGSDHGSHERQVVFAWMDKVKWASWLKSMYGIKKGPNPAVVVVDHQNLLYYDSFANNAPIEFDTSSIIAALEGVNNGVLPPKHSENLAERFARWLHDWMSSVWSSIYSHPWRSALLVLIMLVGIFIGIKRLLEGGGDTRNKSVYVNSKSGSRLD